MATETVEIDIDDKVWVAASGGHVNVALQSDEPVLVRIDTDLPAPTAAGVANVSFDLRGLEDDRNVYVKGLHGAASVVVLRQDAVVSEAAGLASETTLASVVKAEDAAHVSGDKGVMALAVRTDTMAALAGTTGDYIPLIVDSSGRLWARSDMSDLIGVPSKATFTRPGDTTPYTAGDLVANSTTAGSVTALSFTGVTLSGGTGKGTITGVSIACSGANARQLRAHLFKVTAPTVTNGDNGAFNVSNFDHDNYLGAAEVSCSGTANGGGVTGHAQGLSMDYALTGDTIYCLLEAMGAYTPATSETLSVKIRTRRYQ